MVCGKEGAAVSYNSGLGNDKFLFIIMFLTPALPSACEGGGLILPLMHVRLILLGLQQIQNHQHSSCPALRTGTTHAYSMSNTSQNTFLAPSANYSLFR